MHLDADFSKYYWIFAPAWAQESMIKQFLQFKFRIGLKTDVNENASRLKKSR